MGTLETKVTNLQTDLSDAESDIEDLEPLLPIESYYNVRQTELEVPNSAFRGLVQVDVDEGQTIEISADVCMRKDSGNLGNDARAYIEYDNSRVVVLAEFDNEKTRDGDTNCVSLQWKDTVLADTSVKVVVRGSVSEPDSIYILANQTSISYKIWDEDYTTTTSTWFTSQKSDIRYVS